MGPKKDVKRLDDDIFGDKMLPFSILSRLFNKKQLVNNKDEEMTFVCRENYYYGMLAR